MLDGGLGDGGPSSNLLGNARPAIKFQRAGAEATRKTLRAPAGPPLRRKSSLSINSSALARSMGRWHQTALTR
jgi:hypothetical protein